MEEGKRENKNGKMGAGEKAAKLLPLCERGNKEVRCGTAVMGGCMYLYPYRPKNTFNGLKRYG